MANIIRDQRHSPIPQYLNPETNEYEALTGSDGASNIKFAYKNEYHGIPIPIPTVETAITTEDTWVYNIIVNNVTLEPMVSVIFSLINGDGTVIFNNLYASPMVLNQIQGPIFFKGGIRAVASIEGATIILTT